jgi:hypothetical protein
MFSNEDEICPSNLLFERSNQISCLRLAKLFGILLEKLLKKSVRECNILRFSSEDEI